MQDCVEGWLGCVDTSASRFRVVSFDVFFDSLTNASTHEESLEQYLRCAESWTALFDWGGKVEDEPSVAGDKKCDCRGHCYNPGHRYHGGCSCLDLYP